MAFSEFLNSRREAAKELVALLRKEFDYASVLGVDIKSKTVRVDRNTSNILPGYDTECGFVVKLSNGGVVFEYSTDDIPADVSAMAQTITQAFRMSLPMQTVTNVVFRDEPLQQSFCRESDFASFTSL